MNIIEARGMDAWMDGRIREKSRMDRKKKMKSIDETMKGKRLGNRHHDDVIPDPKRKREKKR